VAQVVTQIKVQAMHSKRITKQQDDTQDQAQARMAKITNLKSKRKFAWQII
jgi:hypothetical protein